MKIKIEEQCLKIVLIYLGRHVPRYVVLNANRLSSLHNLDVYLYTSADAKLPDISDLNPSVFLRKVRRNSESRDLHLLHNFDFRDGFWFHTFERLLYLKDIHQELGPNKRILHVEADMLIMPTFPFASVLGTKIKWFRHNDLCDVASLVYLPNIVETKWLHTELISEMKKDPLITDMSALRRIRRNHPSKIELFDDLFSFAEQNQSLGVYDGAGIGTWICGVDPRNTFGIHFLHENNNYKPEGTITTQKLFKDGKIYLDKGSLKYKNEFFTTDLHCIHIHSKDERLFYVHNESALLKYLRFTSKLNPIVISVDWSMMYDLICKNVKERSLKPYLMNFIKFAFKGDKLVDLRLFAIMSYFIRRSKFK